jgi:hypothetical protein
LARLHHKRIEEDETADAVGSSVDDAADYGVAEGMADENDIGQIGDLPQHQPLC